MARKKRDGKAAAAGDRELPGVMPEVVEYPEITKLTKEIKAKRSEWAELGGEIGKLNDKLIEKMHARGITTYVTKNYQVTIVEKGERVKIKDINEEEAHEAA